MSRRVTPALMASTVLMAGLVGCSADTRPSQSGQAPPVEPKAAATPTPQVPAGKAPQRAFAVGVRQLKLNRDGRALPTTLWYPAAGQSGGAAKRSAAAAEGRFPVVMFSHGLGGRPDDYATLLTTWAAAGFVVAAPTFPHTSTGADNNVLDVLNQPADVSYALDQVLALDAKADDQLQGRLDADRVAAAGHSAGGVTTIGLFTANRDERLDAGVVFAGTALGVGTAFAGAAAPQLFVHGELDEVVEYAAGKAAYDKVPWPKAMLSLPKGDHGRTMLKDRAALRVVSDTSIEFLRWSLYGDAAAKQRIPTGAARGDIATFDNHL
ncbi:S9 family peptidase [Micromonospora sp. LAH09]|uniref:alpha/beta hydrolase family protein n=1 Tax=Micromonospora cabrerizensis TaxID=2911213 RepID=UPI001EE935FA|nr:S9 family peptidase [Micromonospora cabrerizensis]MCG5467805.1 S9 family peptidase [Micromonospora cabrerizensis]